MMSEQKESIKRMRRGRSGSISSIGSAGSILSIGSFASILSLFSVFSILRAFAVDSLGIWRAVHKQSG